MLLSVWRSWRMSTWMDVPPSTSQRRIANTILWEMFIMELRESLRILIYSLTLVRMIIVQTCFHLVFDAGKNHIFSLCIQSEFGI